MNEFILMVQKIIQKILLRYKPFKAFDNDAACFKSSLIQTVYVTFCGRFRESINVHAHARLTFTFYAHTENVKNSGKIQSFNKQNRFQWLF